MNILLNKELPVKEELACSIGNFDGFHAGHIKVLETLKEISKINNLKSAVITFKPHPKEVITGKKLCKIINFETKKEFLKKLGIDYLIILEFNSEFSKLDKNKFLKFLKENLNCKALVVGEDWHFGKNRQGNVEFVKKEEKTFDIKIYPVKKEQIKNEKVSSSFIRKLLQNGEIKQVNKLLKRKYCLIGKVISGNKLGTKIGFPTINVDFEENMCLKYGVYVGFIEIENKLYKTVMNYGVRPTVNGKNPILEAHVIEKFQASYIPDYVKVYFLDFIRPEKKFDNLQQLQNQIEKDIKLAKEILKEVKNEITIQSAV